MANCRYCKIRIEWKQLERNIPKKVIKEVDGNLQSVYDPFYWKPYNLDGTPHKCR